MPRSTPALVTPALLSWARERAGLKLEAAAERAGFHPTTLEEWEAGHEVPTIAQARKLGEIYKRPLAVFFLPEPPRDFDPQREFRRLPGLTLEDESTELRNALRQALYRRQAALDIYAQLGEHPSRLTATAHPQEDPEEVGARIRRLLNISWETQVGWSSASAALNEWRSAIESLGILVFQTSDVSLSEMRGTSITRPPLPVILLNSSDAAHGRIFTMLHEFAHILLANGGHDTSSMASRPKPEDQLLERISNRFASAALLPRTEFLSELLQYPGALIGDDDSLRRIANRIKASPEAILRRLVSLQRVPNSLYRAKRNRWQTRNWYAPASTGGGPPIEMRVIATAGRPFVSLILDAYNRHVVSSADLPDYLGVQLKYVDRVARQLAAGPSPDASA
jgi:Zn-dependent peptidase ImmA (M78 family)/DNA-binding XRE family transcriptional regulator